MECFTARKVWRTLSLPGAISGGDRGVDRVRLDYWGDVGEKTHTIEWEAIPGQWLELDGVGVPNTKRNRHNRTDVEL